MALSASTVWEVRTTGADTNGGGFVTGASGTDFSQQDAAQFTLTTVTTAAANAICLSASAAATMVGNVCQIISGTNFTVGFYQILSVVAGVSFTLDRTCTTAAGSNGVINIGGAIASPALSISVAVNTNVVWIKSGTYSILTTSANVSTGVISGTQSNMRVEGYAITRGDLGTAPILQASGISTVSIVTWANNVDTTLRNITVDGQSLTSIKGFSLNRGVFYKLTAKNCTNIGITGNGTASMLINCVVTGCSLVAAMQGCSCYIACEAYSNSIIGIALSSSPSFALNCLSYSNSGASSDGFSVTGTCVSVVNCVSYANVRDGFRATSGNDHNFTNCIAESNTGSGFNANGANDLIQFCATFGNGTAIINSGPNALSLSNVTGGSSFFSNAAGANFALNNTVGAGAVARAAGTPGTFPSGNTTGYLDIGAAQHQDTPATNLFIVQD